MGVLDDLIRRARRRYVRNLLLKQGIRAASAALAGLILLLLVGTEVLDWPWVLAIVAGSLLAGFRAFRRESFTPDRVAREIDRRLGLHDSLSTALFYSRGPGARRTSGKGMREAQRAEAERLASEVDVVRAVPVAIPKSIYATAILVVVASSLFALRYGIFRTLDLRPPLATFVFDKFHFLSEPLAAQKKKRQVRHADDKLAQFGMQLDEDSDRNRGAQGSTPGLSTESPGAEASKRDAKADASRQRASASFETLKRKSQNAVEGEGDGESAAEASTGERENSKSASSKGEPSGRSQTSQQAANSQHENNGLLDKFRDAMANLMSRLNSRPREGDSQDQASSEARRQDQAQSQRQGEKGSDRAGRRADGSPNGDAEGDQQGEGSQKAQSGPGKQGGRDAEQASKQGQSGIGKDDGSKDVREAEQLAAMGKISELIGKRSQNLTGEVMVEVASGKQELRTAYSQQNAKHADAGGEIHRDEIPLAYQHYVQQYFDEVRKAKK